jgi:hypothetical protein
MGLLLGPLTKAVFNYTNWSARYRSYGKDGADDGGSFVNMAPTQGFQNPTDNEIRKSREQTMQFPKSEIKVGLLTGGIDRPYVFGWQWLLPQEE